MAFQTQLSTVQLVVDNDPVSYVPNTLSYNEGLGEQTVKSQNATLTNAVNLETLVGMVKFDLTSTIENINLAKKWKTQGKSSAGALISMASGKSFSKSFTNMALTNNYEIPLSQDGQFTLEFSGSPAG